jgi:hypothetical protein
MSRPSCNHHQSWHPEKTDVGQFYLSRNAIWDLGFVDAVFS